MAPPPPPQYSRDDQKSKRKPKTKEQLRRSQIKASALMIIFLILLFIIAYLSTVLITNEASGIIEKNSEKYPFTFEVQDIMSQEIPTRIEIEASESVEINILTEENYRESLSVVELRNLSINKNHGQKTQFVFEKYLKPGDYVIIAFKRDNANDITLEYKISRFFLLPFLWLISLLFLIPIITCLVWILLLQSKKGAARSAEYDQRGRDNVGRQHPEDQGYYENHAYHEYDPYSKGDKDYVQYSQKPLQPPHDNAYSESHYPRQAAPSPGYDRQSESRHYANHSPPPERPLRQEPPPQRPEARTIARGLPEPDTAYESGTTTVPCKCGEVIVISDSTRPLRIKCPRCGRRGILEGKSVSPEDEIFY
jgi:methionine-rich copper-binding protein CopC